VSRWVLLALGLLACQPPVVGAACRRDDNCPTEQACTAACVCAVGARSATARCSGYAAESSFTVGNASGPVTFLQSSATGEVVVAWVSSTVQTRVVRRAATGWTGNTFEGDLGAPGRVSDSSSPVGLDPAGSGLVLRSPAGVSLWRLPPLGESRQDLWSGEASVVAYRGREVAAGLVGRGTFRKAPGVSTSLNGTLIDTRVADELALRDTSDALVARFGATAVAFPGPRTLSTTAQRVALASNGSAIAVLDQDGTVQLFATPDAAPQRLVDTNVSRVALDGPGATAALVTPGAVSIYRPFASGWARDGALTTEGSVTAVTFSGDGARLFLAGPDAGVVQVFERR
jgi:WD40 repeat protein